MNGWASSAIGELVSTVSTRDPGRSAPSDKFIYVDLSAVDQREKRIVAPRELQGSDAPSRARQLISAGDILVSTVRPNLNGVARVPQELDGATASTGFCVLRPLPDRLDAGFLFHWVKGDRFINDMVRKATGANYPAVSDRIIHESEIPLPPLPEQRRIAAILNQAEALRAKRRKASGKIDVLKRAIFDGLFGDPLTNDRGWCHTRLESLLAAPLRNGLSPSHSGTVTASVLTLSAITGARFDADAYKVSTFNCTPPDDQTVSPNDLLICRGNGNLHLVGKGYFPPTEMPEVTFPDTMIAARIDTRVIDEPFLQHLWNSPAIRVQIEALARTTNGTFKVNQTMLESIKLVSPPIDLQHQFSAAVSKLDGLITVCTRSLERYDALFSSIQYGAFRGEL